MCASACTACTVHVQHVQLQPCLGVMLFAPLASCRCPQRLYLSRCHWCNRGCGISRIWCTHCWQIRLTTSRPTFCKQKSQHTLYAPTATQNQQSSKQPSISQPLPTCTAQHCGSRHNSCCAVQLSRAARSSRQTTRSPPPPKMTHNIPSHCPHTTAADTANPPHRKGSQRAW